MVPATPVSSEPVMACRLAFAREAARGDCSRPSVLKSKIIRLDTGRLKPRLRRHRDMAARAPLRCRAARRTPYGATKWPKLVARIAEAGSVAGRGCSPSPQDMPDALHVLVLPVAGWVNRPPDNQIAYLREEQRGLRAWRLGWARRVPVVGRGGTQRWRPTQCAH